MREERCVNRDVSKARREKRRARSAISWSVTRAALLVQRASFEMYARVLICFLFVPW